MRARKPKVEPGPVYPQGPEPVEHWIARVLRVPELSPWSWAAILRALERINRDGPTWDGKPLGTRALVLHTEHLSEKLG